MLNMDDSILETDFLTVDGQRECYQTLKPWRREASRLNLWIF